MKHNLPVEVKRDALRVKKYVKARKPVGIVLDGASGSGKTTLAVQLLELLQGREIDYSLQYAMGGKDFIKKFPLAYRNGLRVIIYDEAGDYSSVNHNSAFNKMMDEFFDKFRTFNTVVIFCLPFFNKLPNSLFEKQIPKWLLNVRRSVDDDFATIRSYNLYRMEHMRFYLKKDRVKIKSQVYDKVEPNYGGDATGEIRVYDLPPERSKELDRICTAQKSGDVFRIGSEMDSLLLSNKKDDFVLPSHLRA